VQELMRLKGNKILSNTWKQELIITDQSVASEQRRGLLGMLGISKTRKSIVYSRIASVAVYDRAITADLEIVNLGGRDNIIS